MGYIPLILYFNVISKLMLNDANEDTMFIELVLAATSKMSHKIELSESIQNGIEYTLNNKNVGFVFVFIPDVREKL